MKNKTLIVLLGPTGIGKTELSLRLAETLRCPILNCDSRQLFRGLEICTAAPTAEEQQRAKHYFVGTLDPHDYYSAAQYEQDVLSLTSELFQTHDTLLLSGGSMLYIDAVCKGIDDIPTVDEETRQLLKQRLEQEGLEPLVQELRLLDPEYYAIVDRRNTRRVVHALEICYMTGRTYTSFRKKNAECRVQNAELTNTECRMQNAELTNTECRMQNAELKNSTQGEANNSAFCILNSELNRPFRILKIGLQRPREELFARINARVDAMMDAGLLDEARRWYPERHLNSLNTVGMKELFAYFDGMMTLPEAVEKIKRNTRVYAKKQMTWFAHDPDIHWFHPGQVEEIVELVLSYKL